MREDRSDRMYEVNDLLDRIRTEVYELLDYDPEEVSSQQRERRRREVQFLVSELRNRIDQL